MAKFLKSLLSPLVSNYRRNVQQRCAVLPAARPRVEPLERRDLLARLLWVGPVDGNWNNTDNWINTDSDPLVHAEPTANDVLVFDGTESITRGGITVRGTNTDSTNNMAASITFKEVRVKAGYTQTITVTDLEADMRITQTLVVENGTISFGAVGPNGERLSTGFVRLMDGATGTWSRGNIHYLHVDKSAAMNWTAPFAVNTHSYHIRNYGTFNFDGQGILDMEAYVTGIENYGAFRIRLGNSSIRALRKNGAAQVSGAYNSSGALAKGGGP